jgi:integrase
MILLLQAFRTSAMIVPQENHRLLALKVDDVNLDGRVLQVRRSVWNRQFQLPKSASSERAIPIPAPLVARLRTYLRDVWKPSASGLLFATRNGSPFGSTNIVQRKLWPILDRLKISRCGLHAFRHTLSSLLVESGAPMSVAQAQLGHADPRVTLGIYSHVIGDSHRRAVEKVAEILDYNGLQSQEGSELIQ